MNALANAIKRMAMILLNISPKGLSTNKPNHDESHDIIMKNMNDNEEMLESYRDDSIKNGNFVGAYMAESQRLALSTIGDEFKKNPYSEMKPGDINPDEISKSILSKIDDLGLDPDVKAQLQDYANSDPSVISKEKDRLENFTADMIGRNEPSATNSQLLTISREIQRESAKNLYQVPESPSKQAGLGARLR